jgi:hypothetical protein
MENASGIVTCNRPYFRYSSSWRMRWARFLYVTQLTHEVGEEGMRGALSSLLSKK